VDTQGSLLHIVEVGVVTGTRRGPVAIACRARLLPAANRAEGLDIELQMRSQEMKPGRALAVN
jgi:hypothetical protein